jgi:hypothetical protein
MGWKIEVLGFDSWWEVGILLFTTVSRVALGPIWSPIQWAPGTLSLVVKWPVQVCVEQYLHTPYMSS